MRCQIVSLLPFKIPLSASIELPSISGAFLFSLKVDVLKLRKILSIRHSANMKLETQIYAHTVTDSFTDLSVVRSLRQ